MDPDVPDAGLPVPAAAPGPHLARESPTVPNPIPVPFTIPRACPRRVVLPLLALAAALALDPPEADAFPLYGSGCDDCHPGFQGEGPLHQMHAGPGAITNECMLCHWNAPVAGDEVFTYQSGMVGGQGCRGCHGRDTGGATGWASGLRVLHEGLFPGLCTTCHSIEPTPPGEGTLPVYYGRPDVALTNPCAVDPLFGGEDWNGDGFGLDNDGDGLFDLADPDCGPVSLDEAAGRATWGRVKALYRER